MDSKLVDTSKVDGHNGQHEADLPLAERKARLLRQAEFHRQNILSSKAAIKHGSRPDVIWHNAVDHATYAVKSRVDMVLRPTGVNVQTLAPYALSLLAFLRQRRLLKPALGIAAVGAGVALFVKHRRNQHLSH